MPIDPQTLEHIRNPTGGRLSSIGQTFLQAKQAKEQSQMNQAKLKESEQTQISNTQTIEDNKLKLADKVSQIQLGYTSALTESYDPDKFNIESQRLFQELKAKNPVAKDDVLIKQAQDSTWSNYEKSIFQSQDPQSQAVLKQSLKGPVGSYQNAQKARTTYEEQQKALHRTDWATKEKTSTAKKITFSLGGGMVEDRIYKNGDIVERSKPYADPSIKKGEGHIPATINAEKISQADDALSKAGLPSDDGAINSWIYAYDDFFRQTGDVVKAEQLSNESIKSGVRVEKGKLWGTNTTYEPSSQTLSDDEQDELDRLERLDAEGRL